MKTSGIRLLFFVLLLSSAAIPAQAQESKVMQVHSGGSVVYEVPTAQVDSITFESQEAPIDNCDPVFTEDSVWECTEYEGVVIEITFYPAENKLQIKSTTLADYYSDYCISSNKLYLKYPENEEFNNSIFWNITFLSENEMVLDYGGYSPAVALPGYHSRYVFIRQIDKN